MNKEIKETSHLIYEEGNLHPYRRTRAEYETLMDRLHDMRMDSLKDLFEKGSIDPNIKVTIKGLRSKPGDNTKPLDELKGD